MERMKTCLKMGNRKGNVLTTVVESTEGSFLCAFTHKCNGN